MHASDFFNTPPDQPLLDEDLARLSELLHKYGDPDYGLDIESLDGFLSAIVVGPGQMVMPGEYLAEVWGCEPTFESDDDAAEAVTLIMRMNNHIVRRLGREPIDSNPDIHPMIMAAVDDNGELLPEMPADFPLGAPWAAGFMRAVELRADDWQSWCERHEAISDGFMGILDLTLVSQEQIGEMGLDGVTLPTLEDRESIVAGLAWLLIDMNKQRLCDLRPAPVRRTETAGRNDTCPCGSGRKYKRCCGDPARLN